MRRLVLSALSAVAALTAATAAVPPTDAEAVGPLLVATWDDLGSTAEPGERLDLRVAVAGLDQAEPLVVRLAGATVVGVPAGCRDSTIAFVMSAISVDGRTLRCMPRQRVSAVVVPVRVDAGADAGVGGGRDEAVTADVAAGGAETRAPDRRIRGVAVPDPRRLRLLSSPDFLNADVGDLRRGPSLWRPGRPGATENSVNDDYRRALDRVLADWRRADPAEVLVAGDLVEGWWGTDPGGSGNFGPVTTHRQQRQALRRAAATYYPQWRERFAAHDLVVRPAMGDHEYGDNPWPLRKRRLAAEFRRQWAERFTLTPEGRPRYADRPVGSPHELSAYAWRPHPDVQLVTVDVLDITPARRVEVALDPGQLAWLESVLARAQADGVRWVFVQGHTPVLGPVRSRASSRLQYAEGADSAMWQLFEAYGVDLYLCGEVHDVTASQEGGVAQVAHGGLFQHGLTNYLLLDVHDDRVELALRDFRVDVANAPDGSRLWQTRPTGLPKRLSVARDPVVLGTAVLRDGEGLSERTGLLAPYQPPVVGSASRR